MKLVTFNLNGVLYALDVMIVDEIIPLPAITSVANLPSFIRGIIDFRGYAVPIIDLKERLCLGMSRMELDNDVIIVCIQNEKAGLIVDDVLNIMDVDNSHIIPPPNMYDGNAAHYMSAAAKINDALYIILDIGVILNAAEKENFIRLNAAPDEAAIVDKGADGK